MPLSLDAQEGYRKTLARALGAWEKLPKCEQRWEGGYTVRLLRMVQAICELSADYPDKSGSPKFSFKFTRFIQVPGYDNSFEDPSY